jgi:hypothetical protein
MSDVSAGAIAPTRPLPVAGWYPDPAGSDELRWWSGAAWTDHLQPRAQPAPAPTPSPMQWEPVAPMPQVSPVIGAAANAKPYVPFSQPLVQQRTTPNPTFVPVGTTASVWILVLTPLGSIAGTWMTLTSGNLLIAGASSLLLLIAVIAAVLVDRRNLINGGIEPPSGWWILLAVLAYLIARTVALHRHGISSMSPIILHLACWALSSVIAATAIAPTFIASFNTGFASTFNSSLVEGMEKRFAESLATQSSTTWVVDCPDDAPVATPNARFTCVGTDTSGLVLTISAMVDGRGQINFTATRSAATPS